MIKITKTKKTRFSCLWLQMAVSPSGPFVKVLSVPVRFWLTDLEIDYVDLFLGKKLHVGLGLIRRVNRKFLSSIVDIIGVMNFFFCMKRFKCQKGLLRCT